MFCGSLEGRILRKVKVDGGLAYEVSEGSLKTLIGQFAIFI